ncbi:MAG: hypothetical protein ACLQM8_27460 [Limisphaerales bacterium]
MSASPHNQREAARIEREVAHFLATGEADVLGRAFPDNDALERLTGYERHLRNALIEEVGRRELGHCQRWAPADFDPAAWTRRKVEPMITGLFPAAERPVMLDAAERSIVFLTREAAHSRPLFAPKPKAHSVRYDARSE